MKKYLVIGAVIIPLILLLVMTIKKRSNIRYLLDDLKEHYIADKVSVFKFYKDGESPVNLGISYTHMKCVGESISKHAHNLCEQQQATQLNVLAEFIDVLSVDGMYQQPDVRTEASIGLKAMGDAYGIKSTYARFLYNRLGKPIGLISLSYHKDYIKIDDFQYYNEKCNQISEFIDK